MRDCQPSPFCLKFLLTAKKRLALFCLALTWVGLVHGEPPPRVPWTTSKVIGSPEPPAPARVERIFPKLNFPEPIDFAYEPVTKRWFVGLLGGRLLTFSPSPEPERADLAGDLRGRHTNLTQFLGFTFHPGFATNRFLFAVFTEKHQETNRWVIARYQITTATPPELDLTSETIIITSKCGGHDGACVKFGPDGMLYASLGDASSPEPPDALKTGQDLSDLLASVIRLDVDHPAAGQNYRVPADNPFVNRPGARPEVWAYGFRNPWRMNFGPDGALWVGDVGWELWELIHRVTPGYNGGWAFVEGPQSVRSEPAPPTPVNPAIALHPHHEAASITGGLFYHGPQLPGIRGAYVYGDYATGKIWALRHEGERQTSREELCDTSVQIVSFAEDPAGEIVMLDHRGDAGIYRLIPNSVTGNSPPFPRRLSDTGLFADVRTQTVAAGVQPYRINAEMWQDHAISERWLAIPGTNRWHNGGFPANSVVVKTLSLELEHGNPASRRRLETQLLHAGTDGWQAFTYRWNDAQTDAELVPAAGAVAAFKVKDSREPGGQREQTWRFPSRSECLRCHNPWSGTLLGLGHEQLHTGTTDSESSLRQLIASGTATFDSPPQVPQRWPSPYDSTAAVEPRARVWLHLNCAACHRFGAGGAVASFFNQDAKLEDLRLINQIPTRGTFGLDDARILDKGQPEKSVLWYRINTEGQGHMPHIGSRLVDPDGSRLLGDWIESLGQDSPAQSFTPGSTSDLLAGLRASQRDPTRLEAFLASARTSTNALAGDLARRFLPPEQRRHVLGPNFDPQTVLTLTGNPDSGRRLFHSESGPQCARCHVCEGVGRNYGPDLTAVGRRYNRATLLEHLVAPSQLIAPEYVLHLIETKDDRSFSGFPERTGNGGIQLRLESGESIRLTRDEIAALSRSPLSAMPEGLLSALTATEVADLLAYLSQAR